LYTSSLTSTAQDFLSPQGCLIKVKEKKKKKKKERRIEGEKKSGDRK